MAGFDPYVIDEQGNRNRLPEQPRRLPGIFGRAQEIRRGEAGGGARPVPIRERFENFKAGIRNRVDNLRHRGDPFAAVRRREQAERDAVRTARLRQAQRTYRNSPEYRRNSWWGQNVALGPNDNSRLKRFGRNIANFGKNAVGGVAGVFRNVFGKKEDQQARINHERLFFQNADEAFP
jgi:hypothetical protein